MGLVIVTLDNFKEAVRAKFAIKELGALKSFLGIDFSCTKEQITMSQSTYIKKILDRFGMTDCKTKTLPCATGINKELSTDSKPFEDITLYREMVGSLIYVMIATRPDISYVVNVLSQNLSKPTNAHMSICKNVYRFLKGSMYYELKFTKSIVELYLHGFCDSDWGSSSDRKSISGYCFFLNPVGPPISWRSSKQRIVALSSCEAEYVAITDAMKEGNYLRQLYADMTGSKRKTVQLHVDNQGAIALAKNPVHHKRTKHIDIRYHFIRFEIANGIVNLTYIPSEQNIADMFTKPLPSPKLKQFHFIRG